MFKISKLIASIAIASGAMIGTNANAVLLPDLGCKRLHGDKISCDLPPQGSSWGCYLSGPARNSGCVSKFMRIGAGQDFSLVGMAVNTYSHRPFSSEISIQRDDGVLIHKESLNCPADYCNISLLRQFKNSHKRNKSFQTKVRFFKAESRDALVGAYIQNY